MQSAISTAIETGVELRQTAASGAQLAKPSFFAVFVIQLVLLIIISAGLLFTAGKLVSYSVLLGGLISIGPNMYFSRLAFRYSGARNAPEVTRSFYRGEAGKFIQTAFYFAVVFAMVKPLNIAALFLMYIFMTVLNWFLALRTIKK